MEGGLGEEEEVEEEGVKESEDMSMFERNL